MPELRERVNNRRDKAKSTNGLVQAFKQAPWRIQVQSIGLYLLGLVIILVVSSIYLSISGRAAAAGLQAYQMDLDRLDLEREIADRKARIAQITSANIMEERATAMGFERISPEDVIYMQIPGYAGKQAAVLAAPPGIAQSNEVTIKTIYRQSLWDWLFSGIYRLSDSVSGGNS